MRIHRNSLSPYKNVELDEEIVFDKLPDNAYPILGIKNCYLKGEAYEEEGKAFVYVDLFATLVLADSRSGSPFEEDYHIEEEVPLLLEDDPVGEGYVLDKLILDTKELAYCLLHEEVPIKPLAKDSYLPESGEGYSVIAEDEYRPPNGAFDALKDIDI